MCYFLYFVTILHRVLKLANFNLFECIELLEMLIILKKITGKLTLIASYDVRILYLLSLLNMKRVFLP